MPAAGAGPTLDPMTSPAAPSRLRRIGALLLIGSVVTGCRETPAPLPAPIDGPAGVTTESVALERVVDGDTVVLVDGRTVRITGIDTPETKHPQVGIECHGPEASRYAEEVLTGVALRLEPDGGSDRYGRTLGHIWYRDGNGWSNYGLDAVSAGHADLYRAADHHHRDDFEAAQRDAQDAGRGLWGACG
jgi:micrococcal nuclease